MSDLLHPQQPSAVMGAIGGSASNMAAAGAPPEQPGEKGVIHGLVETLIMDRQSRIEKNNFPQKIEALSQTLTSTGLQYVGEWNVRID